MKRGKVKHKIIRKIKIYKDKTGRYVKIRGKNITLIF